MTEKERVDTVRKIQKILFPNDPGEWDGIIGQRTRAAFQALSMTVWTKSTASSFADPEDVRKYKECRARGNSEAYCLRYYGDNGVGYWNDDTTTNEPAVALNKKHITAKWGTMSKGKHKPVDVIIDNKIVTCILKDTGAPYDRVDLNPGAAAAFNLSPPILVPAEWRWA